MCLRVEYAIPKTKVVAFYRLFLHVLMKHVNMFGVQVNCANQRTKQYGCVSEYVANGNRILNLQI